MAVAADQSCRQTVARLAVLVARQQRRTVAIVGAHRYQLRCVTFRRQT